MSKAKNEVQVKSSNAVSTEVHQAAPEVLASDMVVPYVVIAQGTSDSVKERKAQLGDIVRSTTLEKLGDPDKALEVIFLGPPSTGWVIEEKPKNGNRFEYRGAEPRNAANENLPWSWWGDEDGNEVPVGTKGATEWRRVKILKAFALLAADVASAKEEMKKIEAGDLPDPDKALTPVVISFRSSSYRAGKDLVTFFSKAKSLGAAVFRYIVKLSVTYETSGENSYYVWKMDTVKPKAVTKDDLPQVENWAAIVGRGNVRTDEGADTRMEGAATPINDEVV